MEKKMGAIIFFLLLIEMEKLTYCKTEDRL